MLRNRADREMRMRVLALLPATCLTLLATSGLAQQATSPPSPSPRQATEPGETAPPPAAQPVPQQGTGPLRADDSWGMERLTPTGAYPAGIGFAPTLHLRSYG
jgi:hypothetical protein